LQTIRKTGEWTSASEWDEERIMAINVITAAPNSFPASERYANRSVVSMQVHDPWGPQHQDRLSESSQNQIHQAHATTKSPVATVTFQLDRESRELYIQVVDRETGEVLREVPPAELRRLATVLKENVGQLFDAFA